MKLAFTPHLSASGGAMAGAETQRYVVI